MVTSDIIERVVCDKILVYTKEKFIWVSKLSIFAI